jgi:Domain of unknown function (DUF4249)
MKYFNFYKFFIFFLFLQCLSCISPVGDNFAGLPESSIAVWGVLNPTVPISVQVARVLTLRDKLTADKVIADASVELWRDGIKHATLSANGTGIYRSNILPKIGETWTVKVFSTLGNCEASTTIPVPSPILAGSYYDEVNIFKVDGSDFIYPEGGYIRIKDTEKNGAYQITYPLRTISPIGILCKDSLISQEAVYTSCADCGFVFNDAYFKNQIKDIYLRLSINQDSTKFLVHSLDPNLYGVYAIQGRDGGRINSFNANSLVDFGDPLSAYTNVKGGYGYLGSYSSDSLVVYKRR